jgi:hypothetical protein
MNNKIAGLALAGLIGGGVALTTGCPSKTPVKTASAKTDSAKTAAKSLPAPDYKEIHGCDGHNTCKGLGGCKVTQDKLTALAKRRGLAADKAGAPHDCKGLNECKGLGGCKVTAEDLVTLKAKLKK